MQDDYQVLTGQNIKTGFYLCPSEASEHIAKIIFV